MNAIFLLVLAALVSIVFSFLCSIWEAVLLSITPSYVQRKVMEGSQTGKLLQEYKEDIDRPLSAILTLNTIAHTVGAIMVGVQASKVFSSDSDVLGISSETIVAVVMTLAILILSEIIPKTIGANMWQNLAPFTVRSLRILLFLLFPLVWVSQQITRRLKKDKEKSVLSRADYEAMTQVAAESGELDQSETTIINNLLKLEDLTVKDIMTPRTVISMVEASTTLMNYYKSNDKLRFSRIPVYQDRQDNVIGLVLKDDLLLRLVEDEDDLTMESIKRPILAVKSDLALPTLFETLTQQRSHIAIVVDEYGSLIGLVSMEDLFETLLGLEIMDESDN
ncbi:MAG: hemolysin family protein, partial [Bacteroidota bacterium]